MTTPSRRERFVPCRQFIETAFHRRLREKMFDALEDHSSHVMSALPGSGKTWTVRQMILQSHASKHADGTTFLPIVGTCAPASYAAEQALGAALASNFGIIPNMRWSHERMWLVGQMARMETQLIVIDDAHYLSLAQLMFLKEIVDRLNFVPYCRKVGVCLVAASFGAENPLVAYLSRPEMLWIQFKNRLDEGLPFCTIDGHTAAEVRDILGQFEAYYRLHQMPDLHLTKWSGSIFEYLTQETLDPARTNRATMGNLTKLVKLTVKAAYEQELTDITADLLYDKAVWLASNSQNALIDGDPGDSSAGDSAGEGQES